MSNRILIKRGKGPPTRRGILHIGELGLDTLNEHLYVGVGALGKVVGFGQPDWTINDSSTPGYIKNRTHYSYFTGNYTTFLEEKTYSFEGDIEFAVPYLEFEKNVPYIVNWNGTEYKVRAEYNGDNYYALVKYSTEDPDLPFTSNAVKGWATFFNPNDSTVKTVTMSILQEEELVQKIPSKYLPNVENFIVTVVENEDGTFSADKTYEEIKAILEKKQNILCFLNSEMFSCFVPLVISETGDEYGYFGFYLTPFTGLSIEIIIDSDNSIGVTYYEGTIQIGKQTWYGNEPIDFTDTINDMIDVKTSNYFIPSDIQLYKNELDIAGYTKGILVGNDGSENSNSYYVSTGYISCKAGDILYTKNIFLTNAIANGSYDNSVKIVFYDQNKNKLSEYSHVTCQNLITGQYYASAETTTEGFKLTIKPTVSDWGTVAYARLVIRSNDWGTNPIISINNEIKSIQTELLTDAVSIKGEKVILTSPNGNCYYLTVKDDGTLSTTKIT